MSINQRVDGGRREAEHGKVDYKESSDDEEVELFSRRKSAGGTDPPGVDIRDMPEVSDAQRDEWLFKTEPLQGARPRWDEDGRPPMLFDQTGVVDMEAVGGGSQSECGTARRSDPDVAARAVDFAGGGGENATEEGGSWTPGPSGA